MNNADKEHLVITLEHPIKVHYNLDGKNDFIDLNDIYLRAPSYKEGRNGLILKKKFIEAIVTMTSGMTKSRAEEIDDQNKDNDMDEKSIKAVLYGAKDFDIVNFYDEFKKLLEKVAYKSADMLQRLNNMELDKLSYDDIEKIVVGYIKNFFIVSWMKTLS